MASYHNIQGVSFKISNLIPMFGTEGKLAFLKTFHQKSCTFRFLVNQSPYSIP